jgi:hypothetical protein
VPSVSDAAAQIVSFSTVERKSLSPAAYTPSTSRRRKMSHIVSIETEVRDAAAARAACERLRLPTPVEGSHELFSGKVRGLGVQLPNWQYRVVCQLETGKVEFDNFGGRWGDQRELDRFLQAYAVEKAKLEARRKGYSVSEQSLPNGSIKVSIQVGGAA